MQTLSPPKQMLDGLLRHLIIGVRPDFPTSGEIETGVIGLGRQGIRHAGLMKEFGTTVTAGVSAADDLKRIHESIPVYPSIAAMVDAHPRISVVSIWKHFSTAADAAIEAINCQIPIVVVIAEGIPVKDMRRVLDAASRHQTLVFGPNTPGLVFPPERVKIGMLPDIFQGADAGNGRNATDGVTICSRSGAMLYHISDALASAGIAQNGVFGVGGDAVVGTPFVSFIPRLMDFDGTDLVVVAGEIGGSQEELLAEDVKANPQRYPKPIVALLSGRCAPAGKTMGHAGAIIAPKAAYGTYAGKKALLESAGITVVNSQPDLVAAVQTKLNRKTYFDVAAYKDRMRALWEAPPPRPTWSTAITHVVPNNLTVRGYSLADLIGRRSLLEMSALLVTGEFPSPSLRNDLEQIAMRALFAPVDDVPNFGAIHISRQLAAMLLSDATIGQSDHSPVEQTAHCLGRVAACIGRIHGRSASHRSGDFAASVYTLLTGRSPENAGEIALLEGAVVASVDHGVTPPSAQATLIAASVRADFSAAIAAGIGAITDVHGGAGAKAAEFFRACVARAKQENVSLRAATVNVIHERAAASQRIEGIGHRIHQRDPRRDVLWNLAEQMNLAGPSVEVSRIVEDAFEQVRGFRLPVNVDGVIGAIVADLDLEPRLATSLFILGRTAGLAAHYYEESSTQPPMRQIDFAQATYRPVPHSG